MSTSPHPFTKAILSSAIPPVTGKLELTGLQQQVSIVRDAFGIPHIKAQNEDDAFFAQAFASAQDRLWHMEHDRRRAYGRMAEVVGPSALEEDKRMRRFGIASTVAKHYQRLQKPTQKMLEAYAQGVNAFMASDAKLPAEMQVLGIEPEPWLPTDSLAVFMVRHILMGVWESKLWRARLLLEAGAEELSLLSPGYAKGGAVLVPPLGNYQGALEQGLKHFSEGLSRLTFLRHGVDDGSNNWVVGGGRTRTGKPLIAGDPHRALDVPNVYYQNHVCCPGFDVIGFSFPGVPGFPHFAHNAHVAWSITHGNGDYQDLYIEQFDPQNPKRCLHQQQWVEAKYTKEEIRVKGQAATTLEVWRTPRGPVVEGDPRQGWALSFRYTASEEENPTLDAVYAMLRVKNADALEKSMADWVDPVNNLVYFDLEGQFGYRTRGRVPIRAEANRWLPAPGWDGEHEWKGVIPFVEMPAMRNPKEGFAYSANNRITNHDYPHYIGLDFAPEFRAVRIRRHLENGEQLGVEDMARIHADIGSVPAERFAPFWKQITPTDSLTKTAHTMLQKWDGEVGEEGVAPSIFTLFKLCLTRLVLEERLSQHTFDTLFQAEDRGANSFMQRLQARLSTLIANNDTRLLTKGRTWAQLMTNALERACATLKENFGDDPQQWQWGRIHQTSPAHPLCLFYPAAAAVLNPPAFAMGGDGDTVHAAGIQLGFDYSARFISVARYIFDGANWENCRWITPSGASGHPGSTHYADQAAIYAKGESIPMTYAWDKVHAQAKTIQTLLPK